MGDASSAAMTEGFGLGFNAPFVITALAPQAAKLEAAVERTPERFAIMDGYGDSR